MRPAELDASAPVDVRTVAPLNPATGFENEFTDRGFATYGLALADGLANFDLGTVARAKPSVSQRLEWPVRPHGAVAPEGASNATPMISTPIAPSTGGWVTWAAGAGRCSRGGELRSPFAADRFLAGWARSVETGPALIMVYRPTSPSRAGCGPPKPLYHHPMPRAVAYIRASTADQTQTLDAQRERIAVWAEREGVEVVAYHVDAGVSGTTPAHKPTGLTDALLDVETHRADFLVVTTRDRLARSALDAALIDRDLAKLRARVVAADGDAASNADTDEGRLVRTILDAVAEYEAARTRARTRAVLRHRRQQGLRTGGRLPYGFDELEGRLIPYEPEQNALRRLYELSDAGKSQRQISEVLNSERWPPRGEKWHRSLVRRLIARRVAASQIQDPPDDR